MSGGSASGTTVLNGGVQFALGGRPRERHSGRRRRVRAGVGRLGQRYHCQQWRPGNRLRWRPGERYDREQRRQELVSSGGSASGTTVVNSGIQFVLVGGQASETVVDAGGFRAGVGRERHRHHRQQRRQEIVYSGGRATGAIVSSGGQELVSSGGSASGTTVVNGGFQFVVLGGQASATTIDTGGQEFVFSGGQISGATLAGGTLQILSGGTAGSSLITISSGTLVLDDSLHFSGTVAGLATSGVQNVDLKGHHLQLGDDERNELRQ